jgi:hypothetical protein
MIQSRWFGPVLLAFCTLSFSAIAQSEAAMARHPFLTNTHTIQLGAAFQELDGDVRATRSPLPPISVDFDALGVDDSYSSWMFGYRWRFADRWRLFAGAFTFDTDGSTTAQRDFNFDGREFSAGVRLDTAFQADTYILDILYSVYQTDNTEIALGGGLHAFDLETEIRGQASVNGNPVVTSSTATADFLAPLPNLRANLFHAINDKLGLGLTTGWLSASYDDYDGRFIYLKAEANYYFHKRWGLNVGYQFTDVEVTDESSSRGQDDWDLEFQGPTISLSYGF